MEKPFDNAMRRQVWSLPELIRQQYEDLEPKTRNILTTPEIYGIRSMILTGCGDSYFAGWAARWAFQQWAGIPAEIVAAIDVSRHYASGLIGRAAHTPLLIAVSNSGQVARVAEAVMRVKHYGGRTLAITGNRRSLIGQHAEKVITLNIPPFEDAPGIRTYLASLLAYYLLAIRMGEVRGVMTMDEANRFRRQLVQSSEQVARMLEEMDRQALELAQHWKDMDAIEFIAAGPEYAAAQYGQAKIFEACGKYAMHVNTEEWLHLNYFVRRAEQTAVMLIVDKHSPSFSRAVETAEYIRQVGRPLAIVTNADKELFPVQARFLSVPDLDCALLQPLTQFLPIALFAGYTAALIGEEYGRGAKGRWSACRDGGTTKNSKIIIV